MPEESTTPDLVEAVTGLFEAANRGDWDAVQRPYAHDAILETNDGMFDAASASRIRRFWEELAEVFEDWTMKVETIVDLGNGVGYAVYRMEGRPASSIGVITKTGAFIYEWVDGIIARVIHRQNIDQGRAAAERLAEERG